MQLQMTIIRMINGTIAMQRRMNAERVLNYLAVPAPGFYLVELFHLDNIAHACKFAR